MQCTSAVIWKYRITLNSAKFSWVFNFANFQPFVKIFQRKFLTRGMRCVRTVNLRNYLTKSSTIAICENLDPQKFSAKRYKFCTASNRYWVKTTTKVGLHGILTDHLRIHDSMYTPDNRTIVHGVSCIIVSMLSFNSLIPRPSHLQFLIGCSLQKKKKKSNACIKQSLMEVGRPRNEARVPMLTVCQSVASCSNTRDLLHYSLHLVVSIIQYVPQLIM